MVDLATSIIDAPLPAALDFNGLKQQGIDQLKQLVGDTWTNYNDSDPGVTTLDQLCYALTELGYCAGFPIEDVLTGVDGKIRYDGQFFEPQDILTSSPVTLDDYRRLVHDCVEDIQAIYITPQSSPSADGGYLLTGRYSTQLYFTNGDALGDVLKQVGVLLNRSRNLGEIFALPQLLVGRNITLAGTLMLTPSADIGGIKSQILQVLNAYAVPPVIRSGYRQLREQGVEADAVFNGPKLTQGWIVGAQALPDKTLGINLFELTTRLAAIVGVEQVQGLAFTDADAGLENIDIAADQVAVFDASGLLLKRSTVLQHVGASNLTAQYLSQMRQQHQSAAVGVAVSPYPPRQSGRYRNIEDYYSIQNTFPDIYGIGPESSQTSLQTASTRQLKGYLMVYDQLLANQFSQLSHVGDLFSFKPRTPAPMSVSAALEYPSFDATYFCQPLYNVPGVMPLLRGNTAFHFQTDPQQPVQAVERESWKRFRQHPSNAYQHGLRNIMETSESANGRRDRLLTHLMARHGDQASDYDDMIKSCHWYGSEDRTRSVVKSIWLQNYQKLSYANASAFDIEFAAPLKALSDTAQGLDNLPLGNHLRAPALPMVDGQLNEALIYTRARLTTADFVDFSTFELKADILLGFSRHLLALCANLQALLDDEPFESWLKGSLSEGAEYRLAHSDLRVKQVDGVHQVYASQPVDKDQQPLLYISATARAGETLAVSKADYRSHLDVLYWLATQRKGFLLIEHLLLLAETEPGSSPFFLSASLIFPDCVGLVRQEAFKTFINTLIERHWPAHIAFNWVTVSPTRLRALIHSFVAWHNSAGDAEPRQRAGLTLARLLNLLPVTGARDAV